MSVDLHLHTHYSDGSWSPAELVESAFALGLKTIAITDHDTLAGLSEAKAAAGGRLEVLNGIEINTRWINPQGSRQDVHILGYFVDEHCPELNSLISAQQEARVLHAGTIVSLLQEKGYDIDFDCVQGFVGKGPIGRPHIAQAMISKGIVKGSAEAYRKLFGRDSEFCIERASVDPKTAIQAICAAGGIASLAHPGKDEFMEELIEELIAEGLQALECFHRGHSNSQVRKYLRLAKINKLLVTGGSDCHGPFEGYAPSLGTVRLSVDYLQQLREYKSRVSGGYADS